MMIKLGNLLNPGILNDRMVGFQGDSEYVLENGVVRMGYWTFLDAMDIDDAHEGNYLTLDYEIDDSMLVGETRWEIENDNGVLCTVQFVYGNDNGITLSDVARTISQMHMKNICLEDAKSHYMHVAQGLKFNIDYCEENMTFESEEEIRELSNMLIDAKKHLMDKFMALMELIDQLDWELKDLREE